MTQEIYVIIVASILIESLEYVAEIVVLRCETENVTQPEKQTQSKNTYRIKPSVIELPLSSFIDRFRLPLE
jgi:hypothetical protein